MGHRPLRDISDLNFQTDGLRRRIEMLERRYIESDLPAAWLIVSTDDMSDDDGPYSRLKYGYSFRTNDEEVFFWNEPAHEVGGFFDPDEGLGSNPYITCARGGTFNCSWAFSVYFAEDIIGTTANPGEWILRIGIDNFDEFKFNDFFWTNGYRDILIDDGQYLGHGPGAGEPPWTYGLFQEIDHKFSTCNPESFGPASFEQPIYWYPTARAIPNFTGPFDDSAEPLSDAAGVFIVQWMSDLTKECFPG